MLHRKRLLIVFICVFLLQFANVSGVPNSVNSILQEPNPLRNGAVQILSTENDMAQLKISEKLVLQPENVRFKPTFSPVYCDADASEFGTIVKNRTDIYIPLSNFNFIDHNVAYLCVSFADTDRLYHLGLGSQFKR